MCGYDPFWIYDMRLEQMYLEQLEENEKDDEENENQMGFRDDD